MALGITITTACTGARTAAPPTKMPPAGLGCHEATRSRTLCKQFCHPGAARRRPSMAAEDARPADRPRSLRSAARAEARNWRSRDLETILKIVREFSIGWAILKPLVTCKASPGHDACQRAESGSAEEGVIALLLLRVA